MNKQETLLETIKNIPELINKQLNDFQLISEKIGDLKTDRLNIIASGTSYNAAMAVKVIAWKNYKLNIEVFYPNFFSNNFSEENFEEGVPYLFISQGGKTISIIESIEKVNALNGVTISLTEDINTPVADVSNISFEIGTIKENFLFRTAGYSLSVLTLYFIILIISTNNKVITEEQLCNLLKQIEILSTEVESTIDVAENWYKNNKTSLTKLESIFVAGGSELWPVSTEADIKLMEMVPLVTNSFEIEELIHGPQNSFNKKMGFFMLVNNDNDLKKSEAIQGFLTHEIDAFSLILSTDETTNLKDNVVLNTSSKDLISIVYITFMQVVSYYLSIERGRDLKLRLNSSIDNYFNKSV